MASSNSSVKILVCGDVCGRWKFLQNRLNKIIKSAGQFEALFCIGDFFGKDTTEIDLLVNGEMKAPLPTYIIADLNEQGRKYIDNPNGGELCENVKFLGSHGLYTMLCGLRIVYIADPDLEVNFNKDDSELQALIGDDQLTGIDILITTKWPRDYREHTNIANELPSDHPEYDSCSSAVASMAYFLKPRYHFSATKGIYYERPPYRNHRVLIEKNFHVTRFMGLAEVKNPANAKYLCALNVCPIEKMDKTELCAQPPDVTENPYIKLIQRNGEPIKERQVQTEQFFYDTKTNKRKSGRSSEGNRKLAKVDGHQRKMDNKMNTPGLSDDCWFCLGNPKIEKHLIFSIGSQVYLALPRGPLVDDHILVLTVGHHRSYIESPGHVRKEIEMYKEALRQYFKTKDKVIVCFERNFKTQHYQLQVVPLPFRLAGELKKTFITFSENEPDSPCKLKQLPKNAYLDEITTTNVPYFYVELPTGERLFNQIPKTQHSCNIQFGRLVLCQPNLLNCPERVDWRDCVDDTDRESELTNNIRAEFQKFEPNTD